MLSEHSNTRFQAPKLCSTQCLTFLPPLVQAAAALSSPCTCAEQQSLVLGLRQRLPVQGGFQTQDPVLSSCPVWAVLSQWSVDRGCPNFWLFPCNFSKEQEVSKSFATCRVSRRGFDGGKALELPLFSSRCYAAILAPFLIKLFLVKLKLTEEKKKSITS